MKTFDYSLVKDPQYFCDNRMEAHSDHVYYKDKKEMQAALQEGEGTSFRYCLNGLWKFHYARNYANVIPGFEKEEYCCYDWEDIHVPAHIQMEGYDAPQYANVQYPWEGREEIQPGEIPERFNPTASYVKYFEVPDQMKGKRLFVSFQGAESGIAVWLNGTFLGYSEDTFTPSEFELTPYLKEGENKLAAQVFKWTSGSWCEDQDFFRFSGIYRDVYLYTIPEVHVSDLKVQTLLDDTFTKADLVIDTKTIGKGKVKIILSKDRTALQSTEGVLDGETQFVLKVDHPELWSAETPVLYDLLLEVTAEDGTVQELIPQRVGFRRFEMKDHIMMLNGKRIVFKGVNRHEFSSVSGRVVSREELIKDLTTMKQNNINAIRTCHYPDAVGIYDLCDEYGLYMIAECNMESHGTRDTDAVRNGDFSGVVPCDRPEWMDCMLDRVNSMYQRDKNHPAILIWSCGNESFGGKVIFEMSQLYRKMDPTRLVHYEGVNDDRRYNDTSDMESRMYTTVNEIREFLAKDRRKPYVCCEYAHAMGNSCGAMKKYMDLTEEEPMFQGGFIWDYIDQSIYKKDRYGKEFQAYGGDFDDHPCDYNFSGNGIVYGGERDASPKMQEVKFCYQNISIDVQKDKAVVKNKNLFVNTDTFACVVLLEKEGKKLKEVPMEVSVEPLSEKTVELPIAVQTLPGEYAVTVSFRLKEDTVWGKRGHEVAFGQGVYEVEAPAKAEKPAKFEVIRSNHDFGVRGENFDVMFSDLNGGLVSYRYGGVEMIKMIPKPNFWRAPIDNDCGSRMQGRMAQWKIASMYAGMSSKGMFDYEEPVVREEKDSVSITYTYLLPTTPQAKCRVTYTVTPDAYVQTELTYDPVEELGDMPEFGMLFKLNADYDRLEWYGLGPQETYADRRCGAKLGVYKNRVADNMAQYLVPQECGNKVGVRYAKVTDARGRGMLFTGDELSFSALPYTPHELENAMHAYELPEVHYTVVRVALAQMGIGGDDSWGAPVHPEYHIDVTKPLTLRFGFRGI